MSNFKTWNIRKRHGAEAEQAPEYVVAAPQVETQGQFEPFVVELAYHTRQHVQADDDVQIRDDVEAGDGGDDDDLGA